MKRWKSVVWVEEEEEEGGEKRTDGRSTFSDHSTALNAHLQRILIVWQIVRCTNIDLNR